jgi:hypothetical protein
MTIDAPETPAERGRRLATTLDAGLRAIEYHEREERLNELASKPYDPHGLPSDRQQFDFERLRAFHSAVQRSWVWRLAQRVRRPLGRAW